MNKNLKSALYVIFDCVWITISWIFAISLLRYNVNLCLKNNWYYLIGGVVVGVIANLIFKLYTGLWRFAGFSEAIKIVCACILMGIYNMVVAFVAIDLSVEWAVIATFVTMVLIAASRFMLRVRWTLETLAKRKNLGDDKKIRVAILGAGRAGDMLIREIRTTEKLNMRPVCVLDDNPNKIGRYINGVRVVGKISEIETFVEKYNVEKIIIAMPLVDGKTIQKIVEECRKTPCKVLTVPGMFQLASGKLTASSIKEVSIQDLLGREQVKTDLDEVVGYIEGKTVMVTGGGGSIGSELCRQIAEANPKKLIILDIYENNAYDIQQELLRSIPNLNLKVLIASVRDKNKINEIFSREKPEIVFHAAAHKHVPLMETSPKEAVKNNIGGTLNVSRAAGENGAEKFILISTDKAVNPTNIMGATKRVCEMIVQSMDKIYDTEYVAVRFGNVLGSNGSVIPLFKKQIEEGGPVTVTHKDIVRYFMTIPEAVSLVLQAGAYAEGGEIFVLDMGEPVKIYDLAVNMIKLSGLEPFKDIEIKVTGLRPGEKLYEERLMEEEGLKKTDNKKISIGKPLEIDEKLLFEKVEKLLDKASTEAEDIKLTVHELVSTYTLDRTAG